MPRSRNNTSALNKYRQEIGKLQNRMVISNTHRHSTEESSPSSFSQIYKDLYSHYSHSHNSAKTPSVITYRRMIFNRRAPVSVVGAMIFGLLVLDSRSFIFAEALPISNALKTPDLQQNKIVPHHYDPSFDDSDELTHPVNHDQIDRKSQQVLITPDAIKKLIEVRKPIGKEIDSARESEIVVDIVLRVAAVSSVMHKDVEMVHSSPRFRIVVTSKAEVEKIVGAAPGSEIMAAYYEKHNTIYRCYSYEFSNPSYLYDIKLMMHEYCHGCNAVYHSKGFNPMQDWQKIPRLPFYPPTHAEFIKLNNTITAGDKNIKRFEVLLDKKESHNLTPKEKKEFNKYAEPLDKQEAYHVARKISLSEYQQASEKYEIGKVLTIPKHGEAKIVAVEKHHNDILLVLRPKVSYRSIVNAMNSRIDRVKRQYASIPDFSIYEELAESDAMIHELNPEVIIVFYDKLQKYHDDARKRCIIENSPKKSNELEEEALHQFSF